jgi:hypothetical protein
MTNQRGSLRRRLALACVSVVLGAGCLGEDGSFGEGEGDDLAQVSSAVTVFPSSLSNKRQYGAMWTWANNGVNVVPLASATTSACFLNGVWGSLKGNDWVGIENVAGFWVLKGTGASSSPAADAYCILDLPSSISITTEMTARDAAVRMTGATATDHTCFLTKIKGDWTSGSNHASVTLKPDNTWWLTVRDAEASARCVRRPPLPIETHWSGSGSLALFGDLNNPNNNKALNSTTNRSYFCSLTRIEGILNNLDGWVGTFNEPASGGGWQWYLGGKKNGIVTFTFPLAGSARCVK